MDDSFYIKDVLHCELSINMRSTLVQVNQSVWIEQQTNFRSAYSISSTHLDTLDLGRIFGCQGTSEKNTEWTIDVETYRITMMVNAIKTMYILRRVGNYRAKATCSASVN